MGNPELVIVEKDRIVALDLENQARKFGYNPLAVFSSGETLLEKISVLKPDIVLMDTDLEGRMSGLDTAGILRETYNLPVVLITAFLDDLSAEQKEGLVPFSYLVKPLVPRELRLSLDMALYRHKMENKLKESEEAYRRFFEDDLSANFIADSRGVILTCNRAFSDMFDFPGSLEVSGINISKLFSDEEEGNNFADQVKTQKKLVMAERKMKSRTGKNIQAVGNFIGQFDGKRVMTGILGYLHDTTEQKQLEEMFRQSQKLEAVGRLSGGIAHDFNNVLTIINGYTAMMREKYSHGDSIEKDIEGIASAVQKAANLTRQLLNFSRRQDLRPESTELNVLISNLEPMINRLIGEEIKTYIMADSDKPFVYADPGMLEQVIINLAVNARDAMPGGGNLVIGTADFTADGSSHSVMGKIPAGEYVEISVSDTGMGIDPEIQEKIFDPFFSTKPQNKGTGLGLSSAYGIIRQSGGFISLKSSPDKGTVFKILLPCSTPEGRKSQIDQQEEAVTEGNETILIVEDDPEIRGLLIRVLMQAGYTAIGVENAGEAILICEREKEISLVVTDFMMPYLNGSRLIQRLQLQYPELGFILTSGFSESSIREREPDTPDVPFLLKPLDPDMLLRYVRRVLDSKK